MEEIRFDVEGKDYYLAPMTAETIRQAHSFYNKAFRKALEDGGILKRKLEQYLVDQGLWNDQKEQEYKNLIKKIAELEFKLNKGGIKVSEGRQLSLDLKSARDELRELISERTELDSKTVEGQAENQRFNYLVYLTLYDYTTRKRVYSSYDDLVENINSELVQVASYKLGNVIYGLSEDYASTLVENKFLKRFGFIDDKYRLINKDGHLIDEEGHLINDEGFRVDENGNRIDINDNPILDSTVETAEFITDES